MNAKRRTKEKINRKTFQDDANWSKRIQRSFGMKEFDILIPLIFLISFINSFRAAMSQYYILQYPDDIHWVYKASEHVIQPIAIFYDKIGTGYRPMINVLYAIGYWLWGSNETFYYLMNGVLFAGSMVFLYLLIKMLHSRLAGAIAVFLYLFLDASFILVWKMNYTTSIAEIFFITSSLYYSIHFFEKADKRSLVMAFILGIFAFLSKEPSILIIPTVNILYLLHKWKSIDTKNRIPALLVNVSLPLLFLLLTFTVSSEVSAPQEGSLIELVKTRLVTYMELEISEQGQLKNPYLILLVCTGTFFFHRFKKEEYGGIPINLIKNAVSILIIALAAVFIQTGSPYSLTGAILIILLLGISFLFGNVNQRLGIAWFGVALAPLLVTTQIVQPTYLAEPNLGMCLFIGVTIAEYIKYIFQGKSVAPNSSTGISRVFKTANIAVVVLIMLLQLWQVPVEINNTNGYQKMVSESQTSFKEAVDYLKVTVPRNGTIYYITTEQRQKVGGGQIDWEVFHWLLCVKGRCDIEVKSLDSLDTTPEKQKGGFVVLLSNLDVYIFVNEYKPLSTSNIFANQKEIKNGDSVAYVLGLKVSN